MTHFPGKGEMFGLNSYAQFFTTKEGRKHIELTLTEYVLCTWHSAGCLDTLSPRWLSLRGWGSDSHFRIVSSLRGLWEQHPYGHLLLILLPDSPLWIQRQQSVTQLYGSLSCLEPFRHPHGDWNKTHIPFSGRQHLCTWWTPPTSYLTLSGCIWDHSLPAHSLCFSSGVSPHAKARPQPVLVLS